MQFKANFRVCSNTAACLTQRFESSDFYKAKLYGGRKQLSARGQVLAFLWFAGNKCCYRQVANLFCVSESTIFRHLRRLLDFFFDISKEIIKFPKSDAEKKEVANKFKQVAGINDVLGCIDGSYIYVRKPVHKIRSTYTNRHDLLSITLQGICDSDKKFIDVFIGAPSKIHDARIFILSPISSKLPNICQTKYHLLGDAAYMLREYLLTPYKDCGKLTRKERQFNVKHCQTRVKIENAFGLLKQRFRQLMRLDFFTVEDMSKFILACCVLHNLCIDFDDQFVEGTLSEINNIENMESARQCTDNAFDDTTQRAAALRKLGEIKRNEMANSL